MKKRRSSMLTDDEMYEFFKSIKKHSVNNLSDAILKATIVLNSIHVPEYVINYEAEIRRLRTLLHKNDINSGKPITF